MEDNTLVSRMAEAKRKPKTTPIPNRADRRKAKKAGK